MGKFFKIRDLKVYNPKVLTDVKVSSMADIHLSHLIDSKKLNTVTRQVFDFEPDYICIAGDLLDYLNILEEPKYLDMLRSWLSDLSTVPVLISLGSHDMANQVPKTVDESGWIYIKPYEYIKNIEASVSNVHILDNRNFSDNRIFVSGYTQTFEYAYSREDSEAVSLLKQDLSKQDFISKEELNVPAISMVHDPIYLTEPEIIEFFKNYDFILSGHMHNGVVPPILDEIWQSNLGIMRPNKKIIAPNARGIIPMKINNKVIYLVVTGGIVKIQETAPRILHFADHLFPSSIDNITITNDKTFETPKVKSYYKL